MTDLLALADRKWKRGLPPGKYYEGMFDDFEVSFTVMGQKWHRRRTAEERAAYIALREHQFRARASMEAENG
jgi:hypothetical protein